MEKGSRWVEEVIFVPFSFAYQLSQIITPHFNSWIFIPNLQPSALLSIRTMSGGFKVATVYHPDHGLPYTDSKSHSLIEASTGLESEHLFTITTFVLSSSESSSESLDSEQSSSKLRDPATLRSRDFNGLNPTDPTASRLDGVSICPTCGTHIHPNRCAQRIRVSKGVTVGPPANLRGLRSISQTGARFLSENKHDVNIGIRMIRGHPIRTWSPVASHLPA